VSRDATPPTTRVAAVIGQPVRHSRSPAIHNAAFAAAGLDWTYMAFEVAVGDAAEALDAMRVLRLGGLSVTMPHKAAVAAAVDEVSDSVAVLGAANCVVPLADGRLRAENTDVNGFLAALKEDAGISPAGRRVVIIGAGGAARAVIHAAQIAGADEIVVVNRTADRARVAARLAPSARVGSFTDIEAADIVVNATSVGMASDLDEPTSMPCPVELIEPGQVAVDLVYSPQVTEWIGRLRARGVEGYNGLSMLVHQAAAAFELWTSVPAPLEVMRRAATAGGR
jgi:shikimate dehydrogenase